MKKDKENTFISIKEKIQDVNIFEYNKALIVLHGANINVARHIPDVRDGLKPSARRILFTMFKDEKLKPGKKKKCAKIVGNVLGKYHPHGDKALYDVIVGIAQPWKNSIPLVKSHGNFGSEYGDGAAAMRYTEAEIAKYSYECFFEEWNERITDMMPNYLGDCEEPEFFPSKYPHLLVGGCFGIGFSLMTGIPSFNIPELVDLIIEMIKNPDKKDCWLIPDFNIGCDVLETDFKKICETGIGSFRVRAKTHIDYDNNCIVVDSRTPDMNISKFFDRLKELRREKKVDGLKDVVDESEPVKGGIDKICIKIYVKNGYNPAIILDKLLKHTKLEDTITCRFNTIYEFENYLLNLRSIINIWLDFRRETKRRIYSYDYSKIAKELTMLEILVDILDNRKEDVLINILRKCKSRSEAADKLVKEFKINDIQADALLCMGFSDVRKDKKENYKNRLKELQKEINKCKDRLTNEKNIDKEIIKELTHLKQKYGRPRSSNVIKNMFEDVLIPDTEHTIILTKKGYVKKLPLNSPVGQLNNNDKATQIININNTESLLLFSEKGKVFNLDVHKIYECSVDETGNLISNYINMVKDKIIAILPLTKKMSEDNTSFIFTTKNGIVKRTLCKNYSSVTARGLDAVILKKEDTLVSVGLCKDKDSVLIYTKNGNGSLMDVKDISITLRMTIGCIGVKLQDNDYVIGLDVVKKSDDYIFMLTSKGKAKICDLKYLDKSPRASKTESLIDVDNEDDKIITIKTVKEDDTITVYLTKGNQDICMRDVPVMTRKSQGKKIVSLKSGSKIIDAY